VFGTCQLRMRKRDDQQSLEDNEKVEGRTHTTRGPAGICEHDGQYLTPAFHCMITGKFPPVVLHATSRSDGRYGRTPHHSPVGQHSAERRPKRSAQRHIISSVRLKIATEMGWAVNQSGHRDCECSACSNFEEGDMVREVRPDRFREASAGSTLSAVNHRPVTTANFIHATWREKCGRMRWQKLFTQQTFTA
jgi:hypothetical protein